MYLLYVLTIALANLALGYGTAVRVRRSAAQRASRFALDDEVVLSRPAPGVATSTPLDEGCAAAPATLPATANPRSTRLQVPVPSPDNAQGTSLVDRAQFEAVIVQWRLDDPVQERSATLGLVSIDQLALLGKEYGDSFAQRLVYEIERLIDDTIRKPRGTDVAARYDQQQFAFFFGDTTPQEATHAIERIRHSIASGRFVLGRETIELTASCGVAGIVRDEAHESLLARLEFATRHASTLGGNRSCLDAGHGPVPLDPIASDVPERTVILDA